MTLYPSTVKSVQFYVLGGDENFTNSYTEVTNKESVRQSQLPVPGGIYDPHMGTTENSWYCHTCGNEKLHCPGHEGHISLKYPVQNPIFKEEIVQWLKIICFNCGGLILDKTEGLEKIPKTSKLSTYVSIVRNTSNKSICISCKSVHPVISRDKNRPVTIWAEYPSNKDSEDSFNEKKQLFNHEISEIFQKVSNDTVELMGKPLTSHPKKFIINYMSVPPNTIRPNIRRMGGGRSTNTDLTTLIKAIVEINNKLPLIIPNPIDDTLEINYTNLDMAFYELVRGSPGNSTKNKIVTNTNKPPRSLASLFPQKTGRIRRNLMGTKVWYAARTVISCDPMIRIDEMGVPLHVAKKIQIPEIVTSKNKSRLMSYFHNKRDVYPGCTILIKNHTGVEYWVGTRNRKLILEEGDTLMRDVIDGDVCIFNRPPTMLSSGMSSHKVVIMEKGNTFRLNISTCVYYNADFDGDTVNAFFACSEMTRIEIDMLANVGTNFISKVNGSPLPGCLQDNLASIVELTHSNVKINKYRALNMFKNVPFKITKSEYTGRELLSLILPMINFRATALHYNESYANYLKYKTEDIDIHVKQGELISGIFDHKACGEERNNSIFHIIHNEYGAKTALDTLINMQQVGTEFIYCKGFTVAVDDVTIPDESLKVIQDKTSAMITEANRITEQLKKGELIPPIGMTVRQFYEQLQINALSLGDDFVQPILSNINTEISGFYKMITMCKKGNIKNLQAITSAMGSSLIDGKRAKTSFGYARTLPYCLRFDTDPISNGFIADSFIRGISPISFILSAQEARMAVINKALSTSIPGQRSRESIKNMESIIANNLRQCTRHKTVVQFLYGGDGIDTRRFEYNTLPIVMISDKEFEQQFHCLLKDIPRKFQNNKVKELLNHEFKVQDDTRKKFRKDRMVIECSFSDKAINTNIICPFNIKRIINNIIYDLEDRDRKELDVVKAYHQIKIFCDEYPYLYINNYQRQHKGHIPEKYHYATHMTLSVIRAHLCIKRLIEKKIDNTILSLILDKISLTAKNALIQYGTPVGSLSSQSLSEPMTQYIMDSHHRSGVTGGHADNQTDTLTRSDELLFSKTTKNMKNPSLLLYVKDEYEDNESKVSEIANHIESMRFNTFVNNLQIFFEEYRNPIHPKYVSEKQIILDFEKHNPSEVPEDLTKWVIRFELDKLTMVLKNMDLNTIIYALTSEFPNIYLVYTHENSPSIVIRCYLSSSLFKTSTVKQKDAEAVKDKILSTIIRGIVGVEYTHITKRVKSYIDEDGSLKTKSVYVISTKGTNFVDVVQNPYLNPYKCQSDSIKEIEQIFGIEAARQKLRSELERVNSEMGSGMASTHYSLYCDELCITGEVNGISKSGLEKRDPKNVLLRTSYSHPIQVLKEAASNGRSCDVHGLSAPLMIGHTPKVGSTYNQISIDHEFINKNTKSYDDLIDEL